MTDLAALTSFRVGGPARRLVTCASTDDLVAAALDVWADDEPWFVLGGGSNVLVADSGIDATVLLVRSAGIDVLEESATSVRVRVAAGVSWDALVATALERGWSGLEPLSGIPGTVGAAPVQNIGAYGTEIADVLTGIDFLDATTGAREWIGADDLGFGYRTSALKRGRAGIVLAVEFLLGRNGGLVPVRYAQLASALHVELGTAADAAAVRETVLRLRASKGMVLDRDDADTWSAGSFFTNPIVSTAFAETVPFDAPRWPVQDEPARVKLSAAWLIEQAGVPRGYALPGSRAAVSTKHTLALTNRGGATAEEIAELARYIQARVFARFGVSLVPEPVAVGAFEV
ncbi:UDP-N-acetylmuramate dehydrogenase [Curtobacterium ammoniigenes]|uniref:UDP-N-acetylmuramate dehydrogenase n=1 Tax=Curtobacterium ammoniigenes TaxID=395387 RepID=UPI00082CD1D0|nr:UDP-N-acetylmuramate dehydrogenase [Curtobacterium ammoniigenes]